MKNKGEQARIIDLLALSQANRLFLVRLSTLTRAFGGQPSNDGANSYICIYIYIIIS